MTKEQLRKSHDAMARFLVEVCQHSDEAYGGNRTKKVSGHYRRARRLIRQAGFKYEPKP